MTKYEPQKKPKRVFILLGKFFQPMHTYWLIKNKGGYLFLKRLQQNEKKKSLDYSCSSM